VKDTPPRPDPSPAPQAPRAVPAQATGVEDDGVDLTLIRWTLSLSPQERLDALQANTDALVRLQDADASQR